MSPLEDKGKLAPSVVWDMGKQGRRFRFLLTENWVIIGYYKFGAKIWLYSLYEMETPAAAQHWAITVMEKEERRGAEMRVTPRFDTAQINRSWMEMQRGLYRQKQASLDTIFRRALHSKHKLGNAA